MPDCPRCQLMLQTDDYEGAEVLFCGTCWGYWLDHAAFEKILHSEVYSFSKSEKRDVLAKWASHDGTQIEFSTDAACPICHASMEQGPIDNECPVVIDRCAEHGVWLDSSEIKQVQVFAESRHE